MKIRRHTDQPDAHLNHGQTRKQPRLRKKAQGSGGPSSAAHLVSQVAGVVGVVGGGVHVGADEGHLVQELDAHCRTAPDEEHRSGP